MGLGSQVIRQNLAVLAPKKNISNHSTTHLESEGLTENRSGSFLAQRFVGWEVDGTGQRG